MFTLSWLRRVGLFAILSACLCSASLDARPPGKKGKRVEGPPPGAEILTVRGTVTEFTTAPKGEKDGVLLTDGTWVHWPPHLQDRFGDIVAKGDRIKVIGWMETGPRGDTKLEVSSLTNLNTNQTRERLIDGRSSGDSVTANGSVGRFTTAPKGEVDGFILSDGQWIHWPPHLAGRFSEFVVRGDKVRVTGFKEVGKEGENRLEVSTLTNLRTNKTVENPDRPAPLAEGRPMPNEAIDREARIRALEDKVDQILLELKRLRKEK